MKVCSFEGCGRKHYAKGLCSTHWQQVYSGKELKPIRPKKGSICTYVGCGRPVRAQNLCRTHYEHYIAGNDLEPIRVKGIRYPEDVCASEGCGSLRMNGGGGKSRKHCRPCHLLLQRHGITLVEARKMWSEQGCVCANCGIEGPVEYNPCREWPIDHDHDCCPGRGCGQCIRGIVCRPCNTGPLTMHVTKEVWEATGRYLGYA